MLNYIYYKIRNFFIPHNTIFLKKLNSSYVGIDLLIEESIFQLLEDFFQKEQPFHLATSNHYEDNPSVQRHRQLLELMPGFNTEEKMIYHELLNIYSWYKTGKYDKEFEYLNEEAMGWHNRETEVMLSIMLEQTEKYTQLITEKMLYVIKHRKYLES